MAVPDNPFEFGRELGAAELVDREAELAELDQALLRGGKHFLIGPRRYGKTSLLAVAAARAAARGAMVLRYNVEAFPGLDALVARIVADAAARLRGPVRRTSEAIGRFFASLRPSLTFNPAENSWSVVLGPAGHAGPVPLVAEALHGLEHLAASRRRPVALILDEFQNVVARDGVASEGQIRAAIQEHRHTGYVFAGSSARLLAAMVGEPDRPFYRMGTRRFLGPVPREAFAAFLARGLTPVCRVTPEGISAILDAAEDVPYNVQLLAHACWEAGRARPRSVLDPAFVAAANHTAATRLDPLYSQLWAGLTPAQQKALLAIVETRGTGLSSAALAARYAIAVPTLQTAIDALEAKGIARTEAAEGRNRLRLEDPLFGAWIQAVIVTPSPRSIP